MTTRSGPAGGLAPSFLLLAGAALALAGCGGGGDGGARPAATALPGCAQPGATIAQPAELASFPLPAGTVLDRSRRDGGFQVVEGFVPGDVESVRDFFRDQLPKAGYNLGEGDAEENEAETEFDRGGREGRLRVHSLADCDGALTVSIAIKQEQE